MTTREQFMAQLRGLLRDITPDEREEALRFYEEYFDEGGPAQEQQILAELGSPEKVAAILRANVPGARTAQAASSVPHPQPPVPPAPSRGIRGLDDFPGTDAPEPSAKAASAEPKYIPYAKKARPDHAPTFSERVNGALGTDPKSRMILLVLFLLLTVPLWTGLLGTIIGLFFGLLGTCISIFCAGFGLCVKAMVPLLSALPLLFASPAFALMGVAAGFIMLSLGVLLVGLGAWLTVWFVRISWRGICKLFAFAAGKRGKTT